MALYLPRPAAYPIAQWVPAGAIEEAEVIKGIMENNMKQWLEGLELEDVDSLWQIWCTMAEQYLAYRSFGERVGPKKFQGRGHEQRPRLLQKSAYQKHGEFGAQTVKQRRCAKMLRRLEELHR